ncbi:hypothetical protein CANINC_002128 [Pichia inconspicua]|uniref:ER-derived vesicles protein ERV29 n=1 Tax=Pichia inconspicua TaxID=52247 RepID=A0A4V4NFT3_9ASCO|nr:hypothetical protein CANINC_002128 [[Candida] inconspicua]
MSYRGPNNAKNPYQPTDGQQGMYTQQPLASHSPLDHHIPHSVRKSTSPLDFINSLIPSDHPAVRSFEKFTEQLDTFLDSRLGFAKPYVPAIGRFFIVATFYEDSFRIMTQWKEQVYYLSTFRHLYSWIVKLFLFFNIITMIVGSTFVILRRQPFPASLSLASIVLLQGLIYGLFFDPSFFLRNISVIGGLLLALSDSLVIDKRSLSMPGLPMLETKDLNKKYFLLAGRIMLIVLFLTFTLSISWSIINLLIIIIGFFACVSIAIGYKTKFSASFLTLLLTIHNCLTNHYWTYGYNDTRRDYLRYEFFQTLSIIGGLLLIVNTGAGELSIDEKKKKF